MIVHQLQAFVIPELPEDAVITCPFRDGYGHEHGVAWFNAEDEEIHVFAKQVNEDLTINVTMRGGPGGHDTGTCTIENGVVDDIQLDIPVIFHGIAIIEFFGVNIRLADGRNVFIDFPFSSA